MQTETFYKFSKILACVALFVQSMYYSITQPGPMDAINGAITGLVIYGMFMAKERKHPMDATLEKIANGTDTQ